MLLDLQNRDFYFNIFLPGMNISGMFLQTLFLERHLAQLLFATLHESTAVFEQQENE